MSTVVFGAELVAGKLKLNGGSNTLFTTRCKRLTYHKRLVLQKGDSFVSENHHYTSSFTLDEIDVNKSVERHPNAINNPIHRDQPTDVSTEFKYAPLLIVQRILVQPGVATEQSITRFWGIIPIKTVLTEGVTYKVSILIEVYENGRLSRVSVLTNPEEYQTLVHLSAIADQKNLAVI